MESVNRTVPDLAMQMRDFRFASANRLLAICIAIPCLLAQDSLQDARQALRTGDAARAIEIADDWIENREDPDGVARWIRANALESLGDYAGAVRDYRSLIRLRPDEPGLFLALGAAGFKNADMDSSIDAWDASTELDPSLSAQLWQRGIAHYYAGRFVDGARQFEIHRTVNPEDVENSVWHFLCVAAIDGADQARKNLIPVSRDARVPMKEILDLYRGDGTPGAVEQAAEAVGDARRSQVPMFYANLYLGLYYEALGDQAQSAAYIDEAVQADLPNNYMWQVARVHQQLRTQGK